MQWLWDDSLPHNNVPRSVLFNREIELEMEFDYFTSWSFTLLVHFIYQIVGIKCTINVEHMALLWHTHSNTRYIISVISGVALIFLPFLCSVPSHSSSCSSSSIPRLWPELPLKQTNANPPSKLSFFISHLFSSPSLSPLSPLFLSHLNISIQLNQSEPTDLELFMYYWADQTGSWLLLNSTTLFWSRQHDLHGPDRKDF